MSKVLTELTPEIVEALQGQTIVLLNVVEKESGAIYSTALSWVFAVNASTVRFAIDAKSDFIKIIEQDPSVLMNFVAQESVFSLTGKASVKVAKTEELTLKLALLEVEVEGIRDIIFYGGKITTKPEFVKTYNADLAKKLDNEVKEAIYSV
ncbi:MULTISPECIES: hypothetical protein [unclassified Paenibacillus]|uniref:hypothetical protein n=1 Tax=unclassified Paenibacillus TaxID=185978 RepID=UPI001AE2615D|nr:MULTISPECIES: hypothetical protein [unclassified Paenibacillus]MBP1157276.1 hypothetical protein [Paenibacillus sp. PvP091]MBP1171985.1 hypothetical protein [Paenibacillus sp. PvR098]MBP2438366.1 hypothetical protein [Paenibacillus sp. PvP052]